MSKVVLGKGLDALIPSSPSQQSDATPYRMMPLDQIAPNPMQPRKNFDEPKLAELAESFRTNGILQPLVVSRSGNRFIIVAGERRYRAARLANISDVPVVIKEELSDTRMLELALVENLHRDDLSPIETSEAYHRLLTECSLTQNELAEKVGKSRTAVANTMRLLNLPSRVKELLRTRRVSEGHARALLALETEDEMLTLVDQIIDGNISVRETEKRTRKPRGRRAVRRNPPAITEMETRLKQILGTSVRILPGGKRGKIEIEYYGDDDLSRLWELLTARQS